MADAFFEKPRLAELYDVLESDRRDLNSYVLLAEEFRAGSVLDIGCGTGALACLLAQRGVEVTGVDPAAASLTLAARKPQADKVRWLLGDATCLPPLWVDLVTMTGNVAQVFLTDEDWASTLRGARGALRDSGHLVFESRNPAAEAWQEWRREQSYRQFHVPGVGVVQTWVEVTDVTMPLVSFEATFVFDSDRAVLTSDSTLRFRSETEIADSLRETGFAVRDVRDAPDRPGREFVFIASRGDP